MRIPNFHTIVRPKGEMAFLFLTHSSQRFKSFRSLLITVCNSQPNDPVITILKGYKKPVILNKLEESFCNHC